MNMDNKIEVNVDSVVDIELAHFERLIEEREAYEEEFFSMEPPTDEIDYLISQYESEIENEEFEYIMDDSEVDFDYSFDREDSIIQLRNEKLIEEREAYEADYFASVDFDLAQNDIFDLQIEAHELDEYLEENNPNLDYGYEDYLYPDPDEYYDYEEEMLYHRSYTKRSQFISSDCGCYDLDYMPHDDGLCDNLDCYDYPDGPDENLCGIKYY